MKKTWVQTRANNEVIYTKTCAKNVGKLFLRGDVDLEFRIRFFHVNSLKLYIFYSFFVPEKHSIVQILFAGRKRNSSRWKETLFSETLQADFRRKVILNGAFLRRILRLPGVATSCGHVTTGSSSS